MSTSLLMLFGYLLGMFGSAVILAGPLSDVMGFGEPRHAEPQSSGESAVILFMVILGSAALWVVTIPLYYWVRRRPLAVE